MRFNQILSFGLVLYILILSNVGNTPPCAPQGPTACRVRLQQRRHLQFFFPQIPPRFQPRGLQGEIIAVPQFYVAGLLSLPETVQVRPWVTLAPEKSSDQRQVQDQIVR